MTERIAEEIDQAVGFIRQRAQVRPIVGIVLGSGLESLADGVESSAVLAAGDIPHFLVPTVEGHPGRLLLGHMEGVPVAVMQGRPHFYEGCGMSKAAMHVWTLRQLGCDILVLTNAAGALNPDFWPGDVMLITDHINLPGLTGHNPLYGLRSTALGPRFVDMSDAYDPALRAMALEVAGSLRLGLRQGVYVMVGGPSYETQAELKLLRSLGADAVGMSTAHEVIAARQCGLRVIGLSGISNLAIRAVPSPLSHDEVLAVGEVLRPKFGQLIRGLLKRLDLAARPPLEDRSP